ncbi:hypothetical protein DAPPUDRAFT_317863 [Daphnia pulex]|uniref:Uncharacterized protein n=1 Tax=Daphnia pulex TaxID=6669 RepID=E9GH66_DAPPU|nr:hypothetical protein DAPPUDRAFT_317863 [Daphnia pulex]|eukprot:EFX81243.1 hypothetical protein DAPPUDRAFT_317863 [Daphnia pulex]
MKVGQPIVQVLRRQSLNPTHLPNQLLISLPTKEGGVSKEIKQVGTGKEQLSPASFDEWRMKLDSSQDRGEKFKFKQR